ncbi:hypothetical protein [Shimazuella kribbensis]|uniref:hypothetical protein n=1 Tax=Shimazuella kribbensis TaxID=139808 RepID=UPI000403B608|nr:hypothetical protein [Shimazuella kribbensis]
MIFLFQSDVTGSGINFVLNEQIARDMYPDLVEKMRPIIVETCDVLQNYKQHSKGNPILEVVIQDNEDVTVDLSPGLGKFIDEHTRRAIFENAKQIALILGEVMNRKTLERERFAH